MIQKTCAASEHVCCRLYARMASKRKGGVQQRLAKAADEEKATLGDSKLAKLLLQKYAWGELSPQQLQEIAAAACRDMEQLADGKTMPDLLAFSQLGSQGANPQNCYRDLMRQVEPKVRTPLAHTATIPFKDYVGDCEQSFFLPHEMLASSQTRPSSTSFGMKSRTTRSSVSTHWGIARTTNDAAFPSPSTATTYRSLGSARGGHPR